MKIAEECDYSCMYVEQVYKALFLLSFFSFLYMSNSVLHSAATFSHFKHLTKADFIFKPRKFLIIVKWSKTMQNYNQVRLITVPKIPICPDCAISNLLALTNKGHNLPLFQVRYHHDCIPLTDTQVRRHLTLPLLLWFDWCNFFH